MSHRPRKRFGQNFLHDPQVIQRILAAVDPQPDDVLVEIGPGRGALTAPLLGRGRRLHAVELDRDLVPALRQLDPAGGRLRVHEADALRFDFFALASAEGSLRLVGNLPYNISTPLLFHLLEQSDCVRDMHFMLQREVVERLAAQPGGKDYGRLSVMVQLACEVQPLFEVGPGAFYPRPRVDSAVVRLRPRAKLLADPGNPRQFAEIVRQAFSQRRKTLRNALRGVLAADSIAAAGVDPQLRAENLSVAQFAALSRGGDGGDPAARRSGAGDRGA